MAADESTTHLDRSVIDLDLAREGWDNKAFRLPGRVRLPAQ